MSSPRHTPRAPERRTASGGRRLRLTLAGAVAAIALLATAAPAGAWNSATSFSITGRGWGHGIGMCQYGAYGYAKHGWEYRDILKHYYTGINFGTAPDDVIRVLLQSGLGAVRLSAPAAYQAETPGKTFSIGAGVTATTTYANGTYKVSAGGRSASFSAPVTFTCGSGWLKVLNATDLGTTGGYRGQIRIKHTSGGLMEIDRVPLEKYLRGVVPHEVSPSWPAEALKAQACAARAYAQRSRDATAAFDVYCDVRDQAYAGKSIENSHTNAAIEATAGVVPTYDGQAIMAFYFSTSGGYTENIENSWQTGPQPYLKGVPDPYDYYSPYHIWKGVIRRSASQLHGPLGAKGSLRAVYVVKRGVSPRIVKAAIVGSGGTVFLHGSVLRVKLGLRDSWAYFTSLSIVPAPSDHPSITAGGSITLKGRIYPALDAGATVTLHYSYSGHSGTRTVATARGSESIGSGYSAKYSSYTVSVSPDQTTTYWFSSGKARSPKTTLTVKAATGAAATPGPTTARP